MSAVAEKINFLKVMGNSRPKSLFDKFGATVWVGSDVTSSLLRKSGAIARELGYFLGREVGSQHRYRQLGRTFVFQIAHPDSLLATPIGATRRSRTGDLLITNQLHQILVADGTRSAQFD